MWSQLGLIFFGGIMSLLGSVVYVLLEGKIRKKDLIRSNARERLEHLYLPLEKCIQKGLHPGDEVYLNNSIIKEIIEIIDEKRIYASPNLLEHIDEIKQSCDLEGPDIFEIPEFHSLDSELHEIIMYEKDELLKIAGLGRVEPFGKPGPKKRQKARMRKDNLKRRWSRLKRRLKIGSDLDNLI